MYIPKLSLYFVGALGAAQTLMTSVSAKSSSGSGECTPFFTDFTKGEADGWTEVTGKGGYKFGSNGLELSVTAPKQFVRMTNSSENGEIISFFLISKYTYIYFDINLFYFLFFIN
jgi:hypothetical protein